MQNIIKSRGLLIEFEEYLDKDLIITKINELLSILPNSLDLKSIKEMFPLNYYNPINYTFIQEIHQFNNLIETITGTLKKLENNIKKNNCKIEEIEIVNLIIIN